MECRWVQSDAPWKTEISRLPGGELLYHAAEGSERPWALTRGPLVYAADTLWWNDAETAPPARVGDDLAVVPDLAGLKSAPKPEGTLGPAYTAEAETVSGRKVRVLLVPFTNIGRWYRQDKPRPARNAPAYSYAIWMLNTKAPEFRERVRLAGQQQSQLAKAIDFVTIGDSASEAAHLVRGGDTGAFNGRTYRHGPDFSYQVKVKADRASKLVVTYWGGDANREFDVLANDRILGTQKLQNNNPGSFFEQSYEIPADLVHGRTDDFGQPVEQVTVRFRTKNQNVAGGVFGLRVE